MFDQYLANAKLLTYLSPISAEYTRGWNTLEDRVHALSTSQLNALLDFCNDKAAAAFDAVCILTSMFPDTYVTPSMSDLLES